MKKALIAKNRVISKSKFLHFQTKKRKKQVKEEVQHKDLKLTNLSTLLKAMKKMTTSMKKTSSKSCKQTLKSRNISKDNKFRKKKTSMNKKKWMKNKDRSI